MDKLGGKIWVDSELGKSCDVKFTLPLNSQLRPKKMHFEGQKRETEHQLNPTFKSRNQLRNKQIEKLTEKGPLF